MLKVAEVLGEKLDWVLWPIFEKQGDSFFKVGANVLPLKVILRRHILLGAGISI